MRHIKNPTAPIVIILLAGVLIAALSGVFNASPVSQAAAAAQNPATEAALVTINQYCVGCHNDRAKIGGVSFQGLTADAIGQHAELFEKAVRKLRGRVMPPPG